MKTPLLFVTLVLLGARASAGTPEIAKSAAELCDPDKGKPAEVAKLLGLPPSYVAPDTTCRILQENVWADDLPDYVFNFVTPTDNGSRFQTVVVYSAAGERVGVYHAQNFPLDLDIVARKRGLPSYIHLEGHGRWMEQALDWAGTFRLENGQFLPVPDKSGVMPPRPRCPDSKPIELARENGIHRRDLRAAICADEDCHLDCVDSKPEACVHNVGAYWVGSFSAANVLEVLLEMKPADRRHDSLLYLLQATPCGWRLMDSAPAIFAGTQDSCSQIHVVDKDTIVCKQRAQPEKSIDAGLAVYMVRNGHLLAGTPMHTHVTPECHEREMITSAITDMSFDDADDYGTTQVGVQVDAARITWSKRGENAETCSAASQRLAAAIKSRTVQLELTRDGLRIPADQLDQLHEDPVPGLLLK